MAHMQPQTWRGGMWVCEDSHGESSNFPEDVFSKDEAAEQCGVDPEDVSYEKGWWVRLSAPGYTDATDWSGPFKSEKLALDYIFNLYDVDASGEVRSEEGYEMQDDLDEDEGEDFQGLGQDSTRPTRRNRRVHNLFNTLDGRWVFRYGSDMYQFQDETMFFPTREAAVRTAAKHGWVVEDNNRVRKAHTGGINGLRV